MLSPRIETKARMFTLTTSVQHYTSITSQHNKVRKIKDLQFGKEKSYAVFIPKQNDHVIQRLLRNVQKIY